MTELKLDFNEMFRGCHGQFNATTDDRSSWPKIPEKLLSAFEALDVFYNNPMHFNPDCLQEIKDLLQDYTSSLNITEKIIKSLQASLDEFVSLTSGELMQASKRLRHVKWNSKISEELSAHGISKHVVLDSDIVKLKACLPAYRSKLDDTRRSQGNYVAPISIPRFDKLFVGSLKICHKLGIVDAVREYLGEAIDPVYVSLQESIPSENWWVQPNGRKTGLEYQHFDFDFNIIKAIIYLSDVQAANGPFRYVAGSTCLNYSRAWLAFYKCFERQLQVAYGLPMGVNGNYYYRTRFLSKEFLADARSVPPILLGVSHFGDDIEPNTALHRHLTEHEVSVLSAEGNCLVFDGSRLIHRGGMVSSGSRTVVQVGFSSRRAFFKSNRARLWSLTKQRIRSLYRR